MKILSESFRSSFGILAFSSVSVSLTAGARAAESLPGASSCAFASSEALLAGAALAGAAAGCAVLAASFRRKAHGYAKHLIRQKVRLDGLSTVESNFRALASVEPQVLVIWTEGSPRLALHSIPTAVGVPEMRTEELFVFEANVKPGGRFPDFRVQVSVPVAPVALTTAK